MVVSESIFSQSGTVMALSALTTTDPFSRKSVHCTALHEAWNQRMPKHLDKMSLSQLTDLDRTGTLAIISVY